MQKDNGYQADEVDESAERNQQAEPVGYAVRTYHRTEDGGVGQHWEIAPTLKVPIKHGDRLYIERDEQALWRNDVAEIFKFLQELQSYESVPIHLRNSAATARSRLAALDGDDDYMMANVRFALAMAYKDVGDRLLNLCWAIEAIPASEEATEASSQASDLYRLVKERHLFQTPEGVK